MNEFEQIYNIKMEIDQNISKHAHLFPTVQTDMAAQLETEREALVNVRKE